MKRIALLILVYSGVAAAQVRVVVHPDQIIGPPIAGFGAQMNPYLYCRPNDLADESAADLERKVVDLSPQHVRIFMLQHWFRGKEDAISRRDPRVLDSFIATCRLAQRAGATINVTSWYGPWTDPDAQMREFADQLEHLVNAHKLTAIQYLTIQNEPNGGTKVTPEKLALLYRKLDEHLTRLGMRERFHIVAGDLVQDNQEVWFTMLQSIAGVCDGYSIHAYWNYWDDAKPLRRLRLPREIVDAMPPANRLPLYVTEFGARGKNFNTQTNDPGHHGNGSPIAETTVQANQLARFMIESINYRYAAAVVWNMEDSLYDHAMQYGLIGGAKDGWPTKPGYHVVKLFTHSSLPGWRAMRIEAAGEDFACAGLAGPRGEVTIYALNLSNWPKKARISGLPQQGVRQMLWNGDGKGQGFVSADFTGDEVTLPPLALVALTTMPR